MPCGVLMNCIFLLVWRLLPRYFGRFRNLSMTWIIVITFLCSLLAWGACATGLLFLLELVEDKDLLWVSIGCCGFVCIFGLIMSFQQKLPPAYNQLSIAHPVLYIAVGILSFCSVLASVILSHHDEVAAGMLACFPDFFLIRFVKNKKNPNKKLH